MNDKVKVIIADDNPDFVNMLLSNLEKEQELEIVGVARDGQEALDLIYELVSNYEGTIISISHNRKYNEMLNSNIDLNIETGKVLQKTISKHI